MHTIEQVRAAEAAARHAYEETTRFKGYTIRALRRMFDTLCDPDDWKAPIAAWVSGEAVLEAVAAIEFFTATHPRVALNTTIMQYMIESEGYQNGPAGDH